MKNPPPEVLAAAHLITTWAAENNLKEFAIAGVQQRQDLRGAGYEVSAPITRGAWLRVGRASYEEYRRCGWDGRVLYTTAT